MPSRSISVTTSAPTPGIGRSGSASVDEVERRSRRPSRGSRRRGRGRRARPRPARVQRGELVDELGVLDRRAADHDAVPRRPRTGRRRRRPNGRRRRSARAPTTFAQIASITPRFALAAVARGVEIDDVDPARRRPRRSAARPRPDRRRTCVSRVVVAVLEPHDSPAAQVDRRIQIHQRHAAAAFTKLPSIAQPDRAALLGVELRGPQRAALDRGREPAAVVAPRGDDRVVGGLGRVRVHEVAPRGIGQARRASGDPACARACSNPSAAAARSSGSRVMRPATIPRPATSGDSSLPSNSICMPTQIPRNGPAVGCGGHGRRLRARSSRSALHARAEVARRPAARPRRRSRCRRPSRSGARRRRGAAAPSRPSAGCRFRSRRPRSSSSARQRSLGRRHVVALDLHRVAQRPGHTLERRLDHVVAVLAVRLRMCSVTRAPSTKPFQNSSASCGSNVPIHSATGSTS